MARNGSRWENHLNQVLLTKPAEVVQDACQVLKKHGCFVNKELKSELCYSSTLPSCVPSTAFYQLDSCTCAKCMDFNVYIYLTYACLRMHFKLCDELSSHTHAHANTLTVEITSNVRIICKAHMHVMCASVFCI